ncbi:MAG TPA: PQQ-binding-like beta-propeller repeat protein, partial [Bryobacteraceae bacterium]|nr:PQQ-binding-like beta-propeller repeat protein [Bryobacteraceae bacterium]
MRLAVLVVGTALATLAQWPQFRGNPSLTGVSAEKLPAKPRVIWTFDATEAIESSAAISGDSVYVGVGNGDLVALDLASGKLRWQYKTGDMLGESSPAVANGIVYVGDLAGTFHAVSAADGKRL